ncbi:MAG: sulfotransferase, partial [Anaerolineae bacterium]|nr:sulfotransferase [Anaerolineae bacterium]
VDASKRPWRLKLLQESGLFDIKVIYLLRDGRAVVNSYYKLYGDFRDSFWRWLRIHLWWVLRLRRIFTPEQVMQIKYEDLATHPEATLRHLCDFIGIPYEEAMLRYKEHEYYGIGGNQKMLSKREDQSIRLDQGWRETLPKRFQRLFALLGGWLNRAQGYR